MNTGRGRSDSPPDFPVVRLFCRGQFRRQFVGLALVTHHFESALRFLVRSRNFGLYFGCGLFHFWREPHVAVVLHAGTGRDETSDDDVLFQSAQVIDLTVDAGFGEHARGLLERGRRDERVGRERSLRDAQEQRTSGSRLAAFLDHALVLFAERELVELFLEQESRIAHVFDLHPTHHLADDHFDVLVADVDALEPVDFLDFVHQVSLQFLFAKHREDVVRVERAIHQRFASFHALAFLHVDVNATGHRIFLLRAVVSDDVNLALTLRDFTELNRAIDFADDRGFMRLAGFEQLDHARQTTGDVFRLGGFARDLRQHIARGNGVAILDHQVSARWHQVALVGLALDHDRGLALLVGRIADHVPRQAGDFVHFFVERDTFLQVLELYRAADFGEDREGVRIPLDHYLAERDRITIVDLQLGAVHDRVALAFAVLVVDDRDGTLTVHHDQVARLRLDGLQSDEAHIAIVLGIEARLLGDSRCGTADVEGTHGELRSRFTDGLRRDDAGGFAQFDEASRRQVAAVAHHADAALRFARQHGADFYALNAGSLNRSREVFGDFLVDVDHHVPVVVFDLLERYAADDAVTQRFDDLAGFHDTLHVDAVDGSAVVFADDDVLRDVDQTASQVSRIGRLERRVGQSLTGAVRRDEVFEHRQSFTEVCRDGRLDDFAGRLGHQSTHAGELADLLFRSSSAGVGHDVNRIEVAFFVAALHFAEHLVGHFFRDRRPDFDDLVVAFAVGDRAVQVLLLNVDHLLLGILDQRLLAVRDDHVVDADRQSGSSRKAEAQRLHLVEHLDRGFESKAQIAIIHQCADALLLEQAVDVRHALGKVIVEDGAADRRIDERALHLNRLSVNDVLIVVRGGQVDQFARVAQTDRAKRFHFARIERHQDFFNIGEGAAFTFRARLRFREVVETENHVLGGHGDRLTGGRRKNVVRGQHQHAGFDLRFRRQRNVNRHLVAVEVGIERGADQRVNLDGLAFHEHRLECLNAETVKRRSAVQQNGVILDDFFEDVPNDRLLLLDHFLRLLDGGDIARLLEPVINKRLEQFESHLLRQAALVQLEFGADHNDGTSGVVDALAEQVLAEASLLAFQRVRERLQRTVVGAT